jgi:hypothetical protein
MEDQQPTNNLSADAATAQSALTETGSEGVSDSVAAPTEQTAEPGNDSEPVGDETSTIEDPRFKEDPTKVYESYREMELKYGEASQKAKLVDKIAEESGLSVEEISNRLSEKEYNRPSPEGLPETDPASLLSEIQNQVYSLMEDQELRSLIKEIPDAEKFANQIKKIGRYETNKDYKQIYKETFKPAIKLGINSAHQKLSQKEKTQVESAAKSTPSQTSGTITPESLKGAYKDPAKMKQIKESLQRQGLL